MGKYDIPAAVDYVLNRSNAEKLYYIGHSMGTTMFFVAMNENPGLSEKIALMGGMGPVAKVKNMISPIKYLAPYIHDVEVEKMSSFLLHISQNSKGNYTQQISKIFQYCINMGCP